MTSPSHRLSPVAAGSTLGLAAVAMWGAYLAFARAGMQAGLQPQDFVLLRFGIAGLLMLPWLLAHGIRGLAGVGWGRGAILALFAGPAFVALGTAGYAFAPLTHGAVLLPTSVTLGAMAGAWLTFGERPTVGRLLGIAVIIAGLILIASSKGGVAGPDAWKGDLLFIAAGLFWAAFTILLRQWRVAALPATAAVSVISATVVVPGFLAVDTLERLLAVTPAMLVTQVLVMGLLSGVLAVIAYGRTVEILGASRAALFPALVPAGALIVGLPATGEMPVLTEWIGAGLATIGLAIAMGAIRASTRQT